MKRAIFPGSFDPFTLGHEDVVRCSLALVDELIIAVGINGDKRCLQTANQRLEAIQRLFQDDDRVKVCTYQCLTIDLAKQLDAQFLIRGIRSASDFEYEKKIADVNRELCGIETIILFTKPKYAHISSSVVRELLRFGKDVSAFLPELINNSIEK